MKPLMIMITYNRLEMTKIALASLQATADLDEIDLHIVDNGSTDGTVGWLANQHLPVTLLKNNIGCPKALNMALQEWRKPSQHVIKMDNDVEILTFGWLNKWLDFLDRVPKVAMIGGYYSAFSTVPSTEIVGYECLQLAVLGNFVIHNGVFMDQVGYFDVLAPEHLYGFEDLIMGVKAELLGWQQVVLKVVQWQPAGQTWVFLGDRSRHVEEMQPLYEQRVQTLVHGGDLYTGPDGRSL